MDNEFGLLSDDEVLFIRAGRILMANPTFKVSEFLDALAQLVSEREDEWSEAQEGWFSDQGLSCEVLRFGNQGWERGRVRIRLEFSPEPPELPVSRPRLLQETKPPREQKPQGDRPRYTREDPYSRDEFSARPRRDRDIIEPTIYPDIDPDY